ncbi:M23 family metallopeptidase [Flaviflexus massiliensis]|uniref:M23 family metallopeptidase n=1 Tax=Flaviflexus massiliensis TaxID=1522309 RepID=UPI001E2A0734|nr:M23 family metallopeptidase [Flaviflexus massiliensis]
MGTRTYAALTTLVMGASLIMGTASATPQSIPSVSATPLPLIVTDVRDSGTGATSATPSVENSSGTAEEVPHLFLELASTDPELTWESVGSNPEQVSNRANSGRDVDSSVRPSGTFDYPTSSHTVLRAFDHLEHNWLPGHRGVDLASRPGEEVRAAGPGRVAVAGQVVDNNVVSIEHDTGLRTTYLPVTPSVSVGDMVETGDVIGTIEEGHCLIGACLHWGAKRGDRYYDPLSLLGEVTIRLYPAGE